MNNNNPLSKWGKLGIVGLCVLSFGGALQAESEPLAPQGRVVKVFDFEDPSLWRYRDPDNIYYAEGYNNFIWGRKDLYIRPCQGYRGTGLTIDIKGISHGQLQFWTPPWPMKKDKYYKVSYKARGVNFEGSLNVFVRGIAGWNTILNGHSITLTDQWKTYAFSGKVDRDYDGIVNPKKVADSYGLMFNTAELGQILIDDICIEEFDENPAPEMNPVLDNPVVQGNLIPNSSCEIERNPFWSVSISVSDTKLYWKDPTYRRVEGGKFGTYCYKLEDQGDSKNVMDFVSIPISVAPNTPYTFSFWAKATQEKGNWGSIQIVSKKGTDGKNVSVSQFFGIGKGPKNLHASEWRRFSVTMEPAPPGVREVWLSIVKGGPGEFFLDGFQFEVGREPTDYQPMKPYEIEAKLKDGMPNIVTWGQKIPLLLSAQKSNAAPDAVIPATLRVVGYPNRVVYEEKVKLETGKTLAKNIEPGIQGTFRIDLIPDDANLASVHENIAARLPEPRADVGRESFFGTHFTIRPYFLDYARKIGIRWQRLHDCSGITKMLESHRTPDEYVWHDEQIDALKAAGFFILGLPDGFPKYALREKDDPRGPVDNEAFANWCQRVAAHYRGKIDDWELVNEPYMGYFYPGNATQFAETFRVAKDAIRAGNPNARVLGYCTDLSPWGFPSAIPKEKILDIDTATIHLYFGSIPGGGTLRIEDDITAYRNKVMSGGNTNIPIWNTEGGYGGASVSFYSSRKREASAFISSAAFASRVWIVQKAAGFDKFFYYTMHQLDTIQNSGYHKMFLEYDRTPTIAAAATAVAAWHIDGLDTKPVPHRSGAEETLFSGKGRTSYVVYKDPISANRAFLNLRQLPRNYRVSDVMGNDLRKDTQTEICVERTPIYIHAETPNYSEVLTHCQNALSIRRP